MPEKNPNEVVLEESDFLISRTDLNGAITYVNEDFCRITGYEKSEVIGISHNIIRHEDMPNSVFQAMWKTIKAGEKWQGFIKNKTKDGCFYWVDAEVTPYIKEGKRIGYKSIRKMVAPEVINKLEIEYDNLKKDEEGSFNTWTVKNENYEAFERLSKELDVPKSELFSKMLEAYRLNVKKTK